MSLSPNWYSPFSETLEQEDGSKKLWVAELQDIARGFCAALFVALPLLYTLEMWARARVIPSWDLAIIVVVAYAANVGFHMFGGFKNRLRRHAELFDALTSMGLGLVASFITLILIGEYNFNTPPEIMVKLLLLEMVPCSFGASLAINQLGSRGGGDGPKRTADTFNPDLKKLLGTLLGAALFAFNIAPTVEPQLIAYGIGWWHTLGLMLFSLFVSYLMVFFANFLSSGSSREGALGAEWVETLFSYLVSLIVASALLWMFGYLKPDVSFDLAVRWVITMGYATTLAGAAGRLIL